MHFGLEGYVDASCQILKVTKHITNGYELITFIWLLVCDDIEYTLINLFVSRLRKMDGIFVFGEPVTSVIAIGSKVFDIYRVQEAMQAKGWNLNTLQFPKG